MFRKYFQPILQSAIKLAHAVNWLLETDKTVTQIAIECGFSNSGSFGKIFKKKYAMAPARFQNSFSTAGVKKI